MIRTVSLTKRFRQIEAVSNLNLEVGDGEVFGFLGPNGAGKTTTIRMMMGIIRPTSGTIIIGGYDLAREPLSAKASAGFVPDRPYLYDKLTGREFLRFIGGLHSVNHPEEKIRRLLQFFELEPWAGELIESYSHGMKQRLAISAALVHSPKALIIDEPMVGMDPKGARDLKTLFRSLASEGLTVFLSTHSLAMAEEVADRVGIIHMGRLIAVGTLGDLRSQAGGQGDGLEEIFLRLTGAEEPGGIRSDILPRSKS
jgi:ABC-2 type transport system ATP-binding protein